MTIGKIHEVENIRYFSDEEIGWMVRIIFRADHGDRKALRTTMFAVCGTEDQAECLMRLIRKDWSESE